MTHRQKFILNLVNESKGIGRADIEKRVGGLYPASKPTIARDLAFLVRKKIIRLEGKGKSTIYLPLATNPLLAYFDIDQYFILDPDKRVGARKTFDFSIFNHLNHLFTKEEIQSIEKLNRKFSEAVEKLSPDIYQKELPSVTIIVRQLRPMI